MIRTRSLIALAAVLLLTAVAASAQVVIPNKPDTTSRTDMSDEELVRSIFDPITEDLKLTADQKLLIATVASATIAGTEPLFSQLDELDAKLSLAALAGKLDNAAIKEFATRQAALFAEISMMMARAKSNFYRILTTEQRQIVARQFQAGKDVQSLGSISNAGP